MKLRNKVMSNALRVFVVFALFCFAGCQQENKDVKDFFLRMDGYCAIENKQDLALAFTYYRRPNEEVFALDEVESVSLDGLTETMEITNFYFSEAEILEGYEKYVLTVNFQFPDIGLYKANLISLHTNEQSVVYPIGEWCFEVGEADSNLLNTWDSPVISSNTTAFAYSYTTKVPDIEVESITYFDGHTISAQDGLVALNGKINTSNASDAYMRYIKPKIQIHYDGHDYVSYGKGCYCGIPNSPEELTPIVQQSLELRKAFLASTQED